MALTFLTNEDKVMMQEYEEVTQVEIRELMQTGCYLQTSNGQPTNKTTTVVDAGYALVGVAPGERYRIDSYIPNGSGIIFYAGGLDTMLSYDEGGKTGGNVRVKGYEVVIPDGCDIMGVSTRRRTTNPISLSRVVQKYMTAPSIEERLGQQSKAAVENTDNEDDRLFALESRLGFSFQNLDKGKVIFMTDGTRPILTDVYAIFRNHNMVLSVAPVYEGAVTYAAAMNDNSTPLEFLHSVQDDGGEIFAHSLNGDALTADTAEQMLSESKRWLMSEGFEIHGWIAPRGIFCAEARKLYAKYYRYGYRASDRADSPLNFARPYLSNLGIDGAKAAIDDCENSKTVIILFHHWSDDEIEGFNLEDLEALLSYIETKNVDVTTYRDCFYTHGSTCLGAVAAEPEEGL